MQLAVHVTIFLLVVQTAIGLQLSNSTSGSDNYLRVAVSGKENSDPAISKRFSFRSEGEFHNVYEKGPVLPGAGLQRQYFFISEDYIVYDGSRERLIPFFDPEQWMNCDCDLPLPNELDIPHRFAVYHPVTVQAPLPHVPRDLYAIKYTGYYYACPTHINPYEYSWYKNSPAVSPCKWIWYQSLEDANSQSQIRYK